jgi:hypothetical protein
MRHLIKYVARAIKELDTLYSYATPKGKTLVEKLNQQSSTPR